MKLILNGGGSDEQIRDSISLFAQHVKGGKVMYIPLAWNNGNMENCIDWFRTQVEPFGISNIIQILDAKKITKEELKKCTGIFIGGGNTYKLLKMLKETPAFENIKEFMLRKDSIIMGGSAGALVFGKSIDSCLDDGLGIKSICDQNLVGLKDTTGFNCINGYSILPHYMRKPEQANLTNQRIERLLSEGYKLICLPEETSLVIEDNKIRIIGSQPAKIITKETNKTIQNTEIVRCL